MMSPDDEPKLYPAWRQVEADLLASGLTYGSIITTELLDAGLGIVPPKTIAEYQKAELVRLRQITALKESLLESRNMLLVSEPGVGYRVVLPEEQTKLSMHLRTREMKSALAKLMREVSHVDTGRLSDAQRQENVDAQAKLGALRSIFRKRLK